VAEDMGTKFLPMWKRQVIYIAIASEIKKKLTECLTLSEPVSDFRFPYPFGFYNRNVGKVEILLRIHFYLTLLSGITKTQNPFRADEPFHRIMQLSH
jgi:hypothetical protein